MAIISKLTKSDTLKTAKDVEASSGVGEPANAPRVLMFDEVHRDVGFHVQASM
jgi:hypothetical protein